MKLKLDENGNVVVVDGKPVYVHDDGKEVPFDAPSAMQKISQLNGEAKSHRERAEAAEKLANAFDGLDAEAARKAIDTVKNYDDKKLVDAGEVEKLKSEMSRTHTEQLAKERAEKDAIQNQLYNEVIGGNFARSKTVQDKLNIPADVAQSFFGKHFSIKDGKPVAKDANGNPIYSRVRAGEFADFDEAMETLIDSYPHKDRIIKASGSTGGGATGGAGGAAGAPKSLADCKTDAEKVAYLQAAGNS